MREKHAWQAVKIRTEIGHQKVSAMYSPIIENSQVFATTVAIIVSEDSVHATGLKHVEAVASNSCCLWSCLSPTPPNASLPNLPNRESVA